MLSKHALELIGRLAGKCYSGTGGRNWKAGGLQGAERHLHEIPRSFRDLSMQANE
jgi:hypothetical protein